MKRVAIYVRVSSEEQRLHGLSVNNQIEALTQFANQKQYDIVDVYNDAGHTARERYTTRPELLRLLADCKLGKIDLIIFTMLDRWFRNVPDYHEVQRVLDENNVKWKSIWEDYETETSSGVFKVNIMLAVAQNEADKVSDRLKASVAYRQSKGIFIGGNVPTGYKLVDKRIIKDENVASAVNAFFESLLNYGSLPKAMGSAAAKGLNLTYEKARFMRSSPIYYGEAYYNPEPYITVEQFNKLQVKRQYVKTKNEYIFARLIRCRCGLIMSGQTATYQSKSGTKSYVSYYCKAKPKYNVAPSHKTICIKENVLEDYLLNNIESLLEEHNSSFALAAPAEIIDIEKTKASLKAKLRRIGDRYEDGDIDREEYTVKRQAILEKIKSLDAQTPKQPSKDIVLPADWKDIYVSLDISFKNHFWRSIIQKIIISEGHKINVIFL